MAVAHQRVETITRHHFNKDMDDYLKQRKSYGKKPFFKVNLKLPVGKPKKQPVEEGDVPADEVQRVMEKSPVQDQTILEKKEEKQGFFARWFGYTPKEDYEPEHEEKFEPKQEKAHHDLDQDVVEVLKIAGKWISKMPPELKQEFKDSQDYAKYKFYIDKMGLTKKKQ